MPIPKFLQTFETIIERTILVSRWMLVPLYLLLVVVLILFAIKSGQEVIHLFGGIMTMSESSLVLSALALVDLVLVANLVVMVVLSGYETFVSSIDTTGDYEKPTWLGKIDAAMIKLKLAVAVVAISSIHLLKAFMSAPPDDNAVLTALWAERLVWMVMVHMTFVASALAMAWVDRLAFAPHRGHH